MLHVSIPHSENRLINSILLSSLFPLSEKLLFDRRQTCRQLYTALITSQLSPLADDFAPPQPPAPTGRSRCRFFASGTCSFGQNCRYRHENDTDPGEHANLDLGQVEEQGELENDDYHEDEIAQAVAALVSSCIFASVF